MKSSVVEKIFVDNSVIREVGTVVAVEEENAAYVVESEGSTYHTSKAVTCLVEPIVGDEVVFTGRASGLLYITAILERSGEQATVIEGKGDLYLKSREGKIGLVAKEGLDLLSAAGMSLTSSSLDVQSGSGRLLMRGVTLLADTALAEVEEVKTIYGKVDSVIDRLRQKVRTSYRFVEEVDHLRSGALDYAAKTLLRLHSHQSSVITSESLTKIDGSQVHIG